MKAMAIQIMPIQTDAENSNVYSSQLCYVCLRWHPSLCAEGLEKGEKAQTNWRNFLARRLMFRGRAQRAEVQRVSLGSLT